MNNINELVKKTIKNLKLNNMNGLFIDKVEDVIPLLNELIEDDSTVGTGDSITLEQLGIFDYLRKRDITFFDKHDESLSKEEKRKIYLSNFDADYFITGTNAVLSNGSIFNIDGNGSRVAPMIYGPKQVIVIVGINKIVESFDDAIQRTRQIAAPMDAIRLNKRTPCIKLNRCVDCRNKDRICNDFVLIAHQFDEKRITVIIVNNTLGY